MNSLLTSKLPTHVTIGGAEVEINTDFRFSVRYEQLFKDNNIDNGDKWEKSLKLYYPILDKTIMTNEIEDIKLYELILNNTDEAIENIRWFYRCGEEPEVEIEEDQEENTIREEIYNFNYDSDKIIGAFMAQYGIDLITDDLHWWQFKAYFNSLNSEHELKKIMAIRATDINSLPKEQQPSYRKLKRICAIPRNKDELLALNAEEELLIRGGDLSELKE